MSKTYGMKYHPLNEGKINYTSRIPVNTYVQTYTSMHIHMYIHAYVSTYARTYVHTSGDIPFFIIQMIQFEFFHKPL